MLPCARRESLALTGAVCTLTRTSAPRADWFGGLMRPAPSALPCGGHRAMVSAVSVQAASRRRLKAAGLLTCVVALMSGCADEAADPRQLPESFDVESLRDLELPDTDCRFARDLEAVPVRPGDRAGLRAWLRCPETEESAPIGFVQVNTVLSGHEPAEDSVNCLQDPREPGLHSCDTRHGMTIVHARAWCARCDSEEQARELMAKMVDLIAKQP
jgi:hypothetical protein